MSLTDLDLVKSSKLTSHHIDHVTCLECCKYFIAPATAACGHSLCHSCWRGRRTCPACATQYERKTLKLNIPLQNRTDNVQVLGEAFEKLFKIKLDEFNLDTPGEIESEKDPDKNVKDWLTSSQNHFSAPIQNSETFSQDLHQPLNPLEISASNILIHTNTNKVASPPKVLHIPPPQDDWDKIEPLPEPDNIIKKQENIIGPMDIEPYYIDDCKYTTDNPRRSSRKRDLKNDDSLVKKNDLSSNMHSSRDSSGENDKKSQKIKQNWNSVKKMRKEFSKLNKKNRSKLNVSIEMVKKTHNLKPTMNTPSVVEQVYNIDENTPDLTNKENEVNNINSSESIDNKQDECHNQNTAQVVEKENIDNRPKKLLIHGSQTNVNQNDDAPEMNSLIKNQGIDTVSKKLENASKFQNKVQEATKMPFIKKSALNPVRTFNPEQKPNCNSIHSSENADDIEISIKIGTTITNILIRKKQDVQVKINTDREVQTSLGPHHLVETNASLQKEVNTHSIDINIESNNIKNEGTMIKINGTKNVQVAESDTNLNKTTSGKKGTASADTATAQFEITESVEKELSNIMECEVIEEKEDSPENIVAKPLEPLGEMPIADKIIEQPENMDVLNDLDIFNSGSVKETNVHILKEPAPSEILISTVRSKLRTQKVVEKRNRDNNDEDVLPKNKKTKMNLEEDNKVLCERKGNDTQHDSEPINYDAIMGQVFASIDADMEAIRKSQDVENTKNFKDKEDVTVTNSLQMQKTQIIKRVASQINAEITPNLNEYFNEKQSENIFSILEKEEEHNELVKADKIPQHVEDLLTPDLCRNLKSTQDSHDCADMINKSSSKTQDYDDCDKSVVEDTPQKNLAFPKLVRASTSNQSQTTPSETKNNPSRKPTSSIKSIINLTDTVSESNKSSRDVTVVETVADKQALETPLTITKFANQIKHKSTPMVRKSLNFDNENDDNDPEQTLCPTSEVVAKTTQEIEFMSKAFEGTPTTPVVRGLTVRNLGLNTKKYCLAGSCLTSTEIVKVKMLCNERKWTYVDKYTKDMTHLIVGVDEENKSQRSVKYMCALAASKWIVSFEWIKKCLQTKEIVNEEYYEALDSTGEPGPRRSRIAKQKLFEGISFYCMPPFSVLDVDTLENMLLAAGGRVVNAAKDVRITADSCQPALLLAEPEHTQEDRFIYLAMEQSIVPVNYEWVLNCLGNYTLESIQELLLCPSSLLPAATAKWPEILLAQDYD